MRLISPTDYMFLALESREHPMHVGGLQVFTPPAGAGPEFVRELHESLVTCPEVAPVFRRRPGAAASSPRAMFWVEDEEIDLDYHVRLSALARPGRVRELLEMTSHWHGSLLDRHRPLWEMHLVEGLEDGRFAVYSKIHHALIDGVSALGVLQKALSDDPTETGMPALFAPRARRPRIKGAGLSPLGLLRSGLDFTGDVAGSVPAAARIGWQVARERDMPLPLTAPRSIFNVPIGGARRFVGQSWPMARIKGVSKALGCTVNDVVLGLCGGALRAYLLERDALPDSSLVAMVPVSLRALTGEDSGNAVGGVLASLGTDQEDPLARMAAVVRSMGQAKQMMSGLSQFKALALAAAMLSPFAVSSVGGATKVVPPTFNVTISNVPGPRGPLYWNGARLDGIYPASIVMDGLALNITVTSNNDSLDFGITGCRRSVPHLQRLIAHLDEALVALEAAAGLTCGTSAVLALT